MGAAQSKTDGRAFQHDIPDNRLSRDDSCNRATAVIDGTHGFEKDSARAQRLLARASTTPHPRATAVLAKMYHQGLCNTPKDHPRAVELYRIAIDGGDVRAMNNLAYLLAFGTDGFPKNFHEAIQLFQRAIAAGHLDARYFLGCLYLDGSEEVQVDMPRSVELFRDAANLGHVGAARALGFIFLSTAGGVQKDVLVAIEFMERAIAKGDAQSMFNLGILYMNGNDGVAPDIDRAVQFFQDAIDHGDSDAMNNLAIIKRRGMGTIQKDIRGALELFNKAIENGNASAMNNLANLYATGDEEIEIDAHRALELYRNSARHGNSDAYESIGSILFRGYGGVQRDINAAFQQYELGVAAGSVVVMGALADILSSETYEVEIGIHRAVQLYRKVIERGDVKALNNLAILLRHGKGDVEKDTSEAIRLFELAVDAGNITAMKNLANMLSTEIDCVQPDFARAILLYRSAIELGDLDAEVSLADILCLHRDGIETNKPEAIQLYKHAIAKGNAQAMHGLATLYTCGGEGVISDIDRAVQLYREAIDLGYVYSMNSLAVLLLEKRSDLEKNVPEAIRLLEISRNSGNTRALRILGRLYLKGNSGIEIDTERAIQLFREAVQKGDVFANTELATILQKGSSSLGKDVQAAIELYEKAVSAGDDSAMCRLGLLYEKGDGEVEKDLNRSIELYRTAIELGNVDALVSLGLIYQFGKGGIEKDGPEAVRLYRRAIDTGSKSVGLSLAWIYFSGCGEISKDENCFVRELREAVQRGDPGSANLLANMRLSGQYNERRDVVDAVRLYEQSWAEKNEFGGLNLARSLLSHIIGLPRDPLRASHILEQLISMRGISLAGATHELAILLEHGDRGVQKDPARAAKLHNTVAQLANTSANLPQVERELFLSGMNYQHYLRDKLSIAEGLPLKCLLLTLGGGKRGKTSTVNSIRRMPFSDQHRPTEMANIVKFIAHPGAECYDPGCIAELEFKDNLIEATGGRLGIGNELNSHNDANMESPIPSSVNNSDDEASHDDVQAAIQNASHPHADVIERFRQAFVQSSVGHTKLTSIVQVWDMAGQVEYEMAHSLFISRAQILLFVTNLKRVSEEDTRISEVRLLCRWMQLAHSFFTEPENVPIIIVGTRKSQCPNGGKSTLDILYEELNRHLPDAVYDSWVQTHKGEKPDTAFIAMENSISESDRESSGLSELEQAIDAATQYCVEKRGCIPMRWYALIDKLLRQDPNYFTRQQILELSVDFPGFNSDETVREADVLAGLQALSSMGRVILFELSSEEWYVFKNVEHVVDLIGRTVKPDSSLKKYLNRKERLGLRSGWLSKNTLFKLWGELPVAQSVLFLKLMIEHDLLVELKNDREGLVVIGVPALFERGSDGLQWGRSRDERDLIVRTTFNAAIPPGVLGRLMAFLHRTLGAEIPHHEMVRQDAALVVVDDGSRFFIGFERDERQLIWKFRSTNPVILARRCLRHVGRLFELKRRGLNVAYEHAVVQDCSKPPRGCDSDGTIKLKLTMEWINSDDQTRLPSAVSRCEMCRVTFPIDLMTGVIETEVAVMRPQKYDIFISHAGPDKMSIAKPLYIVLKQLGWNPFLDKCELKCSSETAPEIMVRAMSEAKLGIFILSPEFAARLWPMKELRSFLQRNRDEVGDDKPTILPVFYRLSVAETYMIYEDGSPHREIIEQSKFLASRSKMEMEELKKAMTSVPTFSGIETPDTVKNTENISAAMIEQIIETIVDSVQSKDMASQ